jgi:hypothetical protein
MSRYQPFVPSGKLTKRLLLMGLSMVMLLSVTAPSFAYGRGGHHRYYGYSRGWSAGYEGRGPWGEPRYGPGGYYGYAWSPRPYYPPPRYVYPPYGYAAPNVYFGFRL